MSRKGFGELIERKRLAEGLSPEELSRRLGRRSKSFVYRLESEVQEPDSETINKLIAILPMSAEELLLAMGVHLVPPEASKLPRALVGYALKLSADDLRVLTRSAQALAESNQR